MLAIHQALSPEAIDEMPSSTRHEIMSSGHWLRRRRSQASRPRGNTIDEGRYPAVW